MRPFRTIAVAIRCFRQAGYQSQQLGIKKVAATAVSGGSRTSAIIQRRCLLVLLAGLAAQPASGQDVITNGPLSPDPAVAIVPPPWNLHLVVTEDVLNRLVARSQIEPREVQDVFEDTPISGQQVTTSRLTLDLQPSSTTGRILMVLDGETSSSTAGFSPQAVINSVGRHQFHATKEILFNGYELATRHAVVSARADTQNVGAVTMFSGRPLGPLVEQVVLGIAQYRQPAAEAFARQRIVEQVYPKFDREIDSQLAIGNTFLKDTIPSRWKSLNRLPERLRVRTTDTHLHLAASVAVPLETTAISPAPDRLVEKHGLAIYLHESLLQGMAERAGLAGRKTTHRELWRWLELLGCATGEPLPAGIADLDVHIEFSDVDPLQIQIVDDETRLTLRAEFKPEGQDLLPMLEVTIPFRLVHDDDDWQLSAGPVQVRSLEGNANGTSLAELTVQKVIEASLPTLRFPRRLPACYWPEGKTPPVITSIRSAAGWLVIGVD